MKSEKIYFHFYPRSEKWIFWLSLFFEKCKVKRFCFHSFLRSECEKKMTRDWDWELKFLEKSRETRFLKSFFSSKNQVLNMVWRNVEGEKLIFSSMTTHFYQKKQEDMVEVEWQTEFVFTPFFSREIGVNNTKLSPFFSRSEMVREREREVKFVKKISRILEKRDSRWGLA